MSSEKIIVKPTIFREYIGSKQYPDNFNDFPRTIIPKTKEFHFIIAFAAEGYHDESASGKDDEGRRGTGNFYKNWIVPPIDAEMIRKLKNEYENVKVVISIGGRGPEYPFNPAAEEIWFLRAKQSLTDIIKDFNEPCGNNLIDGIDISYDTITSGDVNVFARCIGRLINSLRNDLPSINVVSIAPQLSVQDHYQALYAAHENDIDWVNYKFYAQKIAGAHEFEELYRYLATEVYPGHKLLAGFSTDPDDKNNLQPEVFIKACEDLITSKDLPGIFFWNANDSAFKAPHFQTERDAQNLLPYH